jgi:hypothetical protein
MIRLSLMSQKNDFYEFRTIKQLLDYLVTASILNSQECESLIQKHTAKDGAVLDAWYVFQIHNDIREFVDSVKSVAGGDGQQLLGGALDRKIFWNRFLLVFQNGILGVW